VVERVKDSRGLTLEKVSTVYWNFVSWKAPKFIVPIASPVCVEILLAWA
jgi:hypothetical protein